MSELINELEVGAVSLLSGVMLLWIALGISTWYSAKKGKSSPLDERQT